jgi:TM2 domain-containing membrane protein YozV
VSAELDLMRGMTDSQRFLFQTEMLKHRKGAGTAAVLCILGPIGAHRFYLGQIGLGLVMLGLSCTGIGLVVTVPWAVVDLFGIGQLVDTANLAKAEQVAAAIRRLDEPRDAQRAKTPEERAADRAAWKAHKRRELVRTLLIFGGLILATLVVAHLAAK